MTTASFHRCQRGRMARFFFLVATLTITWHLPSLLVEASVTTNDDKAPTKQQDADADPNSPVCQDDLSKAKERRLLHELPCQLWLAPSLSQDGEWGLFTGQDLAEESSLGMPEMLIPIVDVNMNEFRSWQKFVWTVDFINQRPIYLESLYKSRYFLPGPLMHAQCYSEDRTENLQPHDSDEPGRNVSNPGLHHRSTSPLAGAIGMWHRVSNRVTEALGAGDEIFVDCGNPAQYVHPPLERDIPIEDDPEAICLYRPNSFQVVETKSAGYGLVTLASVNKGEVITTTPLMITDRSEMEILHQFPAKNLNRQSIRYTDHVVGKQLLMNYAYGHENSTILLIPTGMGVNFINHNATHPNAYIRWATRSSLHRSDWIDDYSASNLLLTQRPGLIMEFVALRDIEPGEEILIDYGPAWEAAWQEHVAQFFQRNKEGKGYSADYISSTEYLGVIKQEAGEKSAPKIRTSLEQLTNPYPENIRTVCYYEHYYDESGEAPETFDTITWSGETNFACLRPCEIESRQEIQLLDGVDYVYSAVMLPIPNSFVPPRCALPPQHELPIVVDIPSYGVTLMDKEYTTDLFLKHSFRHEIGVPEGFFPEGWMMEDPKQPSDFETSPLKPLEIQPFRWKNTGEKVSGYGYRMGLDPKLRNVLLDFADRLGITERSKDLTFRGNSLRPDSNVTMPLDGVNWFIQRPKPHWLSNMHWISPADNDAHDAFLSVLSEGGFDDILDKIGRTFNSDGLVCYHVTYITVSHCARGYVHYDFTRTGNKTFNVIIPLILANHTGPELEIYEGRDSDVWGLYRYVYDEASVLGGDAYHATAAVDYRLHKEMRLAATVYIADVNEENAAIIMNDFTQAFPPASDPQFLLDWAGKHWKPNDSMVRLPPRLPFVSFDEAGM